MKTRRKKLYFIVIYLFNLYDFFFLRGKSYKKSTPFVKKVTSHLFYHRTSGNEKQTNDFKHNLQIDELYKEYAELFIRVRN
jgi:hypothetical protein